MAKIAMMMGPDFEDSEYRVPYDKLTQAGHQVTHVGRASDTTVQGKRGKEKASIDMKAGDADPAAFDALVIPGGYSPDQIRTDEAVVSFVRRFAKSGRPVAAVCHGPQLLIEADVVAGKTMTSWPSVKTDLQNAGAIWVDKEVVVDGPFITSRKPDDLEAFSRTILDALAGGSRRTA